MNKDFASPQNKVFDQYTGPYRNLCHDYNQNKPRKIPVQIMFSLAMYFHKHSVGVCQYIKPYNTETQCWVNSSILKYTASPAHAENNHCHVNKIINFLSCLSILLLQSTYLLCPYSFPKRELLRNWEPFLAFCLNVPPFQSSTTFLCPTDYPLTSWVYHKSTCAEVAYMGYWRNVLESEMGEPIFSTLRGDSSWQRWAKPFSPATGETGHQYWNLDSQLITDLHNQCWHIGSETDVSRSTNHIQQTYASIMKSILAA